jgi:hypothetical protein
MWRSVILLLPLAPDARTVTKSSIDLCPRARGIILAADWWNVTPAFRGSNAVIGSREWALLVRFQPFDCVAWRKFYPKSKDASFQYNFTCRSCLVENPYSAHVAILDVCKQKFGCASKLVCRSVRQAR